MFKHLTLIFVLCFMWSTDIVSANNEIIKLANDYHVNRLEVPLSGNCPSDETIMKNREWVEHSGAWNKNLSKLLGVHLSNPLVPVKPTIALTLLPVNVDRGMGIAQWSEIVWTVYRSNQKNFTGKNSNCYLLGSVAYYVEVRNENGWPPMVGFANNPEHEKPWLQKGLIGLIEFRWYDPVENKKHRWFNSKLALFLQWVKENGNSPISLPRAVNSLE